jgi:hypothetical protein
MRNRHRIPYDRNRQKPIEGEHDEVWETNGKYLDMLEYQEWKASREASETIHAAAAE